MNETAVFKEIGHSDRFKSGFYDSVNHDRKYTAEDMSGIVDGIFSEGVVSNYKDSMTVEVVSTSSIRIKTGKAFVNHRWVEVTAPIEIPMGVYPVNQYYLYLKIDTSLNEQNGRQASFVVSTSGTIDGNLPPHLKYYKLAKFRTVTSGSSTAITNLEVVIGTTESGAIPFLVVNAIAGNTSDHNEITDARVDFNDVRHNSLGNAIRSADKFNDDEIRRLMGRGLVNDFFTNPGARTEQYNKYDIVYINELIENNRVTGLYLCKQNGTPLSTIADNDFKTYWKRLTLGNLALAVYASIHRNCKIFDPYPENWTLEQIYEGDYILVTDLNKSMCPNMELGIYKVLQDTYIFSFTYADLAEFNTYFQRIDIVDELEAINDVLDELEGLDNIINGRITLYNSSEHYFNGDIVYFIQTSSSVSSPSTGYYMCSAVNGTRGTLIPNAWTDYWISLDDGFNKASIDDILSGLFRASLGTAIRIYNPLKSNWDSEGVSKGDYVYVTKQFYIPSQSSFTSPQLGLYRAKQNTVMGTLIGGSGGWYNYYDMTDIISELKALRNDSGYVKIYDVTLESAISINSVHTINLSQPYPKDVKVFVVNNVSSAVYVRLDSHVIMSDDDSKTCMATNNVPLGTLTLDIQSSGEFKECLAYRLNASVQGITVVNSNPIKGIEFNIKSDSANPISAGSRIVVYGKNF